jgi:hypothetical protein
MTNSELTGQYLEHLEDPLDEILANLGSEIYTPLGARPPSPAKLIAAANEWLEENQSQICEKLWEDNRISDFMRGRQVFQNSELLGIVIDVLLTFCSAPACCWAAIYLVRKGLNYFCPETSDPL